MVFTLRFIEAGCQLLAASRLTLVYLASSYRVHVYSHQESFKVVWSIAMAINYCYWRVDRSKNWWRCVNTVEEVPTLVLFSSSKWSVRGRGLDKLFKSMWHVTWEVRWPATSCHPLNICPCLCAHACFCACVAMFVHVSGAFAQSSGYAGFFWPTYCSRRLTPKKSVLISRLSGQPVCCR